MSNLGTSNLKKKYDLIILWVSSGVHRNVIKYLYLSSPVNFQGYRSDTEDFFHLTVSSGKLPSVFASIDFTAISFP